MSNKPNHRREEQRRTEHGPRWENGNPGKGCNATHVARARKKHKRIRARAERRTDKAHNNIVGRGKKLRTEDLPQHLRDAGVEIDEHGQLLVPLNSAAGDAYFNALLMVGMKKR